MNHIHNTNINNNINNNTNNNNNNNNNNNKSKSKSKDLLPYFLSAMIFVLISAPLCFAQNSEKKSVTKNSFRQISISAMLWHEEVEATKGDDKANLAMQFQGLQARYAIHKPFDNANWRYAYMTDFAIGVVKGKGDETTSIPDEFKNQPWTKINFTPGVFYTTTPVSEVGFAIPTGVRLINWALESDTELKMSKATSVGVGAAIIYINKLSNRSELNITFDHQFLWKTTIVSLGWGYQF